MRDETTTVDWYHNCIHERQRRAGRLTIEVGLNADDFTDSTTLAETMRCLDSAIEALERAKAISTGAVTPMVRALPRYELMMDDLGHSMEPMHFPEPYVRVPRTQRTAKRSARADSVGLMTVVWRDSLRFFE